PCHPFLRRCTPTPRPYSHLRRRHEQVQYASKTGFFRSLLDAGESTRYAPGRQTKGATPTVYLTGLTRKSVNPTFLLLQKIELRRYSAMKTQIMRWRILLVVVFVGLTLSVLGILAV